MDISNTPITVPLGELGILDRGRSRHRPRYAFHLYGGKYPFIQTGDIKASGRRIYEYKQTYSEAGLEQSRLWDKGTLCITIAANIAETAILAFPACFPDSVVGFIANKELCDTEYINYAFEFLRKKIERDASGSVQVNINLEYLRKLPIPLYEIQKQKEIAHILGAFDEKIELNKKTNQTIEDLAKTLFKSWFIDFDPVKAKSEGRSTGLPDEISDLFPDSFEETESGEIPKNWKFFELDEIAEFQNGYAFKSKEYIEKDESSLEIFRMGYIHRGGGFKEDNSPVFVDSSSKGYQKKYSLKKDDLTIAMTDMKDKMAILGCCALVEESNRFLLNQRVGRIRVKNCKILSSEYLYLHMNYPTHIDQIRSRSNSGVQVNLSTDVIKSTPILIPDKLVMEKFSKISNDLFSNILKNNKMTKTIVEMRNILLPKLISGELRIPDAEKMIDEVDI